MNKLYFLLLLVILLLSCEKYAKNPVPVPTPPPQPSPITEKILTIGDSHMCSKMGAFIKSNYTYAGCGSSMSTWIKGGPVYCGYVYRTPDGTQSGSKTSVPTLAELINEIKPTTLIVELGDNAADYGNSKHLRDDLRFEAQKLIPFIKGLKCYWVVPTWGCKNKTKERLNDVVLGIQDGIRQYCTLIDSRPFMSYETTIQGSSDCLHLTTKSYEAWAQVINQAIDIQH